jgi:hypothetical protein
MAHQPTPHDLGVEHLGDELGKLPVEDRITALFCCCYDSDLAYIAKYLTEYVCWAQSDPHKAERRQRVIDEMLASALMQ